MMTRSEVGLRKLIAGMGGTRCSEEAAATSHRYGRRPMESLGFAAWSLATIRIPKTLTSEDACQWHTQSNLLNLAKMLNANILD